MMNGKIKNLIKDSVLGGVIAVIVFFSSYYLWNMFSQSMHEKIEQDFITAAEEIVLEVKKQLEIYSNELTSVKGFFTASDFVSREEFSDFIVTQELFDQYPSIQAFEYVQRVSSSEKQDFIQGIRSEGFTDFIIKPIEIKDEYLVVTYVEPLIGNEAAFGFDLSSNPERLKALSQSRDTNSFTITSPIDLVQLNEKGSAFLAIVPIYENNNKTLKDRRDNLQGFALAVLKYDELFKDIARNLSYSQGLHFTLSDNEETFFNSEAYLEDDDDTGLVYKSQVEIGGRIWQFEAHAEREYLKSFSREKDLLFTIFVSGVAFGLLLFIFFYLINHAGRRATELANEMTDNFNKERSKVKTINKDLKIALEKVEASLDAKNHQQKAILNILEDIEDEKRIATLERDKIDAILHSIGDGVFVIDENKQLTLVNSVTEDISGFSSNELLGKRYDKVLKFIFDKTGKVNTKFIDDAFVTGKVQEMSNHTMLVTKDKRKVPVADSAAPLTDAEGNIIGCVVVFRDVTKEREVDRMKTEFVSVASHQLRTPLSAIKWFLEMVLDGDAGKVTKKQKEFLQQAFDSNERMVALVNDLLNVSRLETGRLAIKPEMTDLVKLSDTLLTELTPIAKAHQIDLKFKKTKNLPQINIDQKLISQVIMNLLSNAIKYTPGKGKVVYSIEAQAKNMVFKIKDSGIGIPKKQQKQVFQKFFRSDISVEKETEGTGLGLYVAKQIVEGSGGKIGFESKEGVGSTFWFTLPLAGSKEMQGEKGLEKTKI